MRRYLANILAASAISSLLLGCGLAAKAKQHVSNERPVPNYTPPKLPPFQANLTTYSSCDDLQNDIHTILAERAAEQKRQADIQAAQAAQYSSGRGTAVAASAASGQVAGNDAATSAAPAAASAGFTNVQEKGVDEADTFKVGDQHFFTVETGKVQVVDRQTLKYLGNIDTSKLTGVTLYTNAAQLIVIGQVSSGENCQAPNDAYPVSTVAAVTSPTLACGASPSNSTEVRFYDAAAGHLPTLSTKRSFDGVVKDSRLTSGHLVLVFSGQLPVAPTEIVTDRPVQLDGTGRAWGVTCTTLMKQQIRDFDFRLTKVLTLPVAKPSDFEQVAGVLGGGDQIYMSNDHLYVAKQGAQWYDSYGSDQSGSGEQLILSRLAINADTGAIKPEGVGSIQGHVKDQWAFKQLSDSNLLAVMTSTGSLYGQGDDIAQNHLWILKADAASPTLQISATLHNFGTGEDIRSVRYIGDLAYVVTFKKTDPIFAIDLHEASAPKLLGELKMPGFSTYLHPVSASRLVGIGFDATDEGSFAWYQGLQVSLFDITDPVHMQRLDNKIIGNRGSYSDATSDHHAFYFDADAMTMAIPAVQIDGGDGASAAATKLSFSGAIVYKIGDTLTEAARLSLADLIPTTCVAAIGQARWWQAQSTSADINRMFKVDGKLIAMSHYGLKSYDPSTYVAQTTTAYTNNGNSCQ